MDNVDKILKSTLSKKIPGIALSIYSENGYIYNGGAGNLNSSRQFFMASATKLYITALVLIFIEEKRLRLNDNISQFFGASILNGLHVYKSTEYTHKITLQNLLAHTSGLPDYFQSKEKNSLSLLENILTVQDQQWAFQDVILRSKRIGAFFPPNSKKALYSDTNFQLLGKILESVSGKKLGELLIEKIFNPLHLSKTYLYSDSSDLTPLDLNYKLSPLKIPNAMSSFWADGGLVSNSEEMMVFNKAFFSGNLFSTDLLPKIACDWNSVFFPLQYGTGIMLFDLPWFFSPFKKFPKLIGHSGLSGAFCFYSPEKKIYLTGTTNQIDEPSAPFRLMLKVLEVVV